MRAYTVLLLLLCVFVGCGVERKAEPAPVVPIHPGLDNFQFGAKCAIVAVRAASYTDKPVDQWYGWELLALTDSVYEFACRPGSVQEMEQSVRECARRMTWRRQ